MNREFFVLIGLILIKGAGLFDEMVLWGAMSAGHHYILLKGVRSGRVSFFLRSNRK